MGTNNKNPILFMEFSEKLIKTRSLPNISVRARHSAFPALKRSEIAVMLGEGFDFYNNIEYNKGLAVVEKFSLRENSLAKSLRYSFLDTTKISIMGSVSRSEFLFSVASREELLRISSIIRFSRNKSLEASLSHIKEIGGFFPNEKLQLSKNFVKKAVFDKNTDRTIRLRCFPFPDAEEKVYRFLYDIGAYQVKTFSSVADVLFIEAFLTDYKPKLTLILNHSYVAEVLDPDNILLTELYLRHEDLSEACVIEKSEDVEYPLIGIIDSGVAQNSFLKKWQTGHEIFVDEEHFDPSHGTFVTGRALTDGDKFGGTEFLDVTVMPGRNGTPPNLNRLAEILRSVIAKYKDKIKIWNFSLGTNVIINENISLFAFMLDSLQQEFDVLFVLPSGNYDRLRKEEANKVLNDDLITIPSESLFSLTVGSISHMETNITPLHSPSLFTRRGRGISYSVKPELVHYGGTHEERFNRLIKCGVFSIGKYNEIAEDSGTSHSSPVVASIAAKTYKLLGKAATVDSVKALIIHKAIETGGGDYSGWGIPEKPEESVRAKDNTITIVHTGKYTKGNYLETHPLPVPYEMTATGRLKGIIKLTLSYRPPISISYSKYYTCMNMSASLGFYKEGKWKSIVTNKDLRFLPDDEVAKNEFYWLPLKDYYAEVNIKDTPSKLFLRINISKRDFWKKNSCINYAVVLSYINNGKLNFSNFKQNIQGANSMLKVLTIL